MHATIRQFKVTGDMEEVSRIVQDGFTPLLERIPGFVSYYWIDTGGGRAISVSVFQTKFGEEESNRVATEFARENLAGKVLRTDMQEGPVQAHLKKKNVSIA
ncbi:MAG: hypothetical protein NVS9B12_13770 [Vulcanimicrobiaceae bacterium]